MSDPDELPNYHDHAHALFSLSSGEKNNALAVLVAENISAYFFVFSKKKIYFYDSFCGKTLAFTCSMASASLSALTDEERQSIQSESSVILAEEMADKKKSNSSSRRSRKSSADKRMDSLQKKFDEKFSSLLEMMKSFRKSQERTVLDSSQSVHDNNPSGVCRPVNCEDNNPSGIRQPLISFENDLNRDFGLVPHSPVKNDTISITPSQREKNALGLLSEDEHCCSDSHLSEASAVENTKKSERFCQYLHEKPEVNYLKLLFIISTKQMGIYLDQAQEDILSKSWRCKDPVKLTAYKEDNKTCFLVHEKSESLLQVPSLDDLLEPMLLKKRGSKSVKAWGKSKQLASQPLKAIERVAFRGQMATRLGILSVCYIQQALGSLLNKLQSKEVNIDSTVQSVRDIFAMSTKALDQVGRTGAFHHIIRRKAAVSDTGLNNLKDVQAKVLYLPLRGDGVFGKGLEENLKKRKEQKEQLVDLIPEYDASKGDNSQKRKFFSNDRNTWSYKKPRYDYSVYNTTRDKSRGASYSAYKGSDYKSKSSDYKGKTDKQWSRFRIPKKQK